MNSTNLITTCEGYQALAGLGNPPEEPLKAHEIHNLQSFCEIMLKEGCTFTDLNGFYIGYSIKQIGKEFDLLKFTKLGILNVELKTELTPVGKEDKILRQMRTNHYYLNAITSNIMIITYVENDGFYCYDLGNDSMKQIDASEVAIQLQLAKEDASFDPEEKFIPSNYLISPYNDPEKFMQDAYFLTTAQNAIKKEIIDLFQTGQYMLFTLQAATGTGKTLLLYDIAKELISCRKSILILHTQSLNEGQKELITEYGWHICSLINMSITDVFSNIEFLLVDEAQMLSKSQMESILSLSIEKKIPVLFSYELKQEQFHTDTFDIAECIQEKEPSLQLHQYKLTNKIRTNKEMALFIDRLMKTSTNWQENHYENITIEYLSKRDQLDSYCKALAEDHYTVVDISQLSLNDLNGQEYKKAALILDQSFYYKEDELYSDDNKEEVLYEVITRVIDTLKIIVINNPHLYQTLLSIKGQE